MSVRGNLTIPSIAEFSLPSLVVKSSLLYAATSAILLIVGAAVLVTVLGILALALLIGVACVVGAVYSGVVANQEYKQEKAARVQTAAPGDSTPPSLPPPT
jgi:hypothetical protein